MFSATHQPSSARARFLRRAIVFISYLSASTDTAFASGIGLDLRYGTSVFTSFGSEVDLDADLTPRLLTLDYAFGRKGQFFASTHMHLSTLTYRVSGASKFGSYTAFGVGGGYQMDLRTDLRWFGHFVYYPWAQVVATSRSRQMIGDKDVVHSSLSQFKGGNGFEVSGCILYRYRGWPFTNKVLQGRNGRIGINTSFLQQSFTRKIDHVLTSSGDNKKVDMGTKFRLTALTLSVPIGVEF